MTYPERAWNYANQVIDGDIPACLYVRQACQRFLDDVDRIESDDGWPYTFDADKADTWCRFLEERPHVRGPWAKRGELFVMADWQVFCTVNIFGWVDKDTLLRRFRTVYIEVPRKNGKSFWIACIGLGMMVIDGEFGAEVYCGATSEKQAWEIFRPAKLICDRDLDFRGKYGIESNARNLAVIDTGSRFEPIIGNPGDGPSPSCAIADEFHEHQSSDQADTMETGMGAREQPLQIYVTTSGSDMGGPCYERRGDVVNILKGAVDDDTIFGIVYTIDEKDAWDTVEAQIKANPSYHAIHTLPGYLEGKLKQARRSPAKQAAYKTKHLDLWVGAKAAWMNMLAYQACRRKRLKIEDQTGRRCFVGIDLASKVDIASKAYLFPPDKEHKKWMAFCRHYLPEDKILDVTRYQGFHAGGWLQDTPGNVIDFGVIEDDLKDARSEYEIAEVPYDPFQATQFSVRMLDEGFPMVEVGATVKNFSEPMKYLEALIISKQIDFEMDPVLLWMFGNVTAQTDKKDNIFPNKEREENKIDGVVALIMAINRAISDMPAKPSRYETQGIRSL